MKTTIRTFACAVLAASFLSVCVLSGGAFAAGFDPKAYIVEDGLLFKVKAGKKTQVEGAEVVEAEGIVGGKIYWLAAGSESVGESAGLYPGWKSGIYFFGNDGKFLSLLESERAMQSYPSFSPDGKRFMLGTGTYVDYAYTLYEFDGFVKKKSFYGLTGLKWLDTNRFVFTLIDTAKKARHKDADIAGWFSVVVYDCDKGTLTTLAEATPTEDFMLDDVENAQMKVTKISVKNEKDWASEDKRASESVLLPLPAAR